MWKASKPWEGSRNTQLRQIRIIIMVCVSKVLLLCLVGLLCSHSQPIPSSTNIVVGTSNLLQGSCNSISGDSNVAAGSSNNINGNSNLLKGASNVIQGNNNLARGDSNSISGNQNVVGADIDIDSIMAKSSVTNGINSRLQNALLSYSAINCQNPPNPDSPQTTAVSRPICVTSSPPVYTSILASVPTPTTAIPSIKHPSSLGSVSSVLATARNVGSLGSEGSGCIVIDTLKNGATNAVSQLGAVANAASTVLINRNPLEDPLKKESSLLSIVLKQVKPLPSKCCPKSPAV